MIIATRNIGKIREFIELFQGSGIQLLTLNDFKNIPDFEEVGRSFMENSIAKAVFYGDILRDWVFADDSGIEIAILNNQPGIYSARFAGENATDSDNNKKVLQLLENVAWEDRRAKYKCVLTLYHPDKLPVPLVVCGECEGLIAFEERGKNGFGYDPIFFYPPFGKTFGEVDGKSKNEVSHRGIAAKLLIQKIADLKERGILVK